LKGTVSAIVLADGHIKSNGFSGSIHEVGRQIQNAPCNGWVHWFYLDESTGELHPIDTLRQQLISQNSIGEKH
jgi:modification methylase